MDKWLRSTWFIRILSLFLAILMWASVSEDSTEGTDPTFLNGSSTDKEMAENVPVDIKLEDEELVVTGVPQVADVMLEGPTSQVAPAARQQNFSLYVELNGLGAGVHEVRIQHSGISNQVQVNVEPKTVEVTIERRMSETHNISADFINESQMGSEFEVGEADINPSTVEVTGAASVLSEVAVVKSIVNLAGVDTSIEKRETPVKVYDEEGNELNVIVEPASVTVDVPVSRSKKEVPVAFRAEGGVKDGVKVDKITSSVEQATIYGPKEVLDDINQVSGSIVNTEGLEETTSKDVELEVPNGVVSIEPETVEVKIEITNE
ncbi:CdaR family protein [Salimicrobium humidisoli]|uniref:YbbR domain-containing protein n=1 Tax=Salimicrobium humidisoli TaxID=2029857 RepID=A0ABX4HRU4_9BACI|nr:CdaR family protein [Salimicrobium humidisoli]PBB05952.1 hypothetical protein CKW00_05550 [Salimicrobium humidisoli]